jgi:histidine triad (HIT) family protein
LILGIARIEAMSDCIFCKIVSKQITAKIIYEDDKALAFEDIHPQAPVHILIIPKEHIPDITQVKDPAIIGYLYKIANKLAEEKKIKTTGYRLVVNYGPHAGMAVNHLHLHLLGGRPLHWPPG